MIAGKQRLGVEWVGGLVSVPFYVMGEGAPYRPEALFWMESDGTLLGSMVAPPGTLIDRACESLQQTIESRLSGTLARVRVESPELAAVLRAAYPLIDIVCAPTPEIEALFEMMRRTLGQMADIEVDASHYLGPDIHPRAVAAFFRAASRFFRARPWKLLPTPDSLAAVTIEEFELREAAVLLLGYEGEKQGFMFFSSVDDFETFIDSGDEIERGETASPPHVVLYFERVAGLETWLRKELVEQRWEVAGKNAYPWLVAIDEDLVGRPPTVRELAIAEAIALALVQASADKKTFLPAWRAGERISCTVHTHAGDLEVTLRSAYEPPYEPID